MACSRGDFYLRERDNLENLGLDRGKMLRWIFKK